MKKIFKDRNYNELFEEFFEIYKARPLLHNDGGMKLPHMFAAWVFLREQNPEVVVESGVWRGQSTWLIEMATTADIIAIDPVPKNRLYVSSRARYSHIDFAYQDFTDLPREKTTLFFDDHVNAFKRLQQGRAWGFKNFIFEDNYPELLGDTPSLRQMMVGAFDSLGEARVPPGSGLKSFIKRFLRLRVSKFDVLSSKYDPAMLQRALARMDLVYEEFPPIAVFDVSRFGKGWVETYGDVPACLDLTLLSAEQKRIIQKEGMAYTSICAVT